MNNKLHNLSILPIDEHNMGHVTNCLTCTIASDSEAIQENNITCHPEFILVGTILAVISEICYITP